MLDLYAGSGQLGIEALSRGAKSCLFVDRSAEALAVVKANCKTAGVDRQSDIRQGEADLPEQAGALTLVKQYNYGKIKVSRYERGEEV